MSRYPFTPAGILGSFIALVAPHSSATNLYIKSTFFCCCFLHFLWYTKLYNQKEYVSIRITVMCMSDPGNSREHRSRLLKTNRQKQLPLGRSDCQVELELWVIDLCHPSQNFISGVSISYFAAVNTKKTNKVIEKKVLWMFALVLKYRCVFFN